MHKHDKYDAPSRELVAAYFANRSGHYQQLYICESGHVSLQGSIIPIKPRPGTCTREGHPSVGPVPTEPYEPDDEGLTRIEWVFRLLDCAQARRDESNEFLRRESADLRARVEKLEETLRFYADAGNYDLPDTGKESAIERDDGKRARAVLP